MGDHMKPQGANPYGATTHPTQGPYFPHNHNSQQLYYPNPPDATPQELRPQNYIPSYGALPSYDPRSSSNDFRSPRQPADNRVQFPQAAPNYTFQTPNMSYFADSRHPGYQQMNQLSNTSRGQMMHPTVHPQQQQQQFISSRPPTPSNIYPGAQQSQMQHWPQHLSNNQQPAVPLSYPESGLRREHAPQVNQGQPPLGYQQPNVHPATLISANSLNAIQRNPMQNAVQNVSLQPNSQGAISNLDKDTAKNTSGVLQGSANPFGAQPPVMKPSNGPQMASQEPATRNAPPNATVNSRQKDGGISQCPMLENPLLKTARDGNKISSPARPIDPSGKDHTRRGGGACNHDDEEEDEDDEYSDERTDTYSSDSTVSSSSHGCEDGTRDIVVSDVARGNKQQQQQLQKQIAAKVATHQHRQQTVPADRGVPVGHPVQASKPTQERRGPPSYETGFQRMSVENFRTCVDLLKEGNLIADLDYEESLPLLSENMKHYNCPPDIMSSTLNVVPRNKDLLKKARLPFGIILQPLKDIQELPVATCMLRCRYCRAYINPFVTISSTRSWRCNLCHRENELPNYYLHDEMNQKFTEGRHRPEMGCSCYEFPIEQDPKKERFSATYVFLIDVSFNAIRTGYLSVLCEQLQEHLDSLCRDPLSRVCFVTFNSHLHFYNIHHSLDRPQVYEVSDLEDVTPPSPCGLLVNAVESKEMLRSLLKLLPSIHEDTTDTGNCLGTALKAVSRMLENIGGRVTVFQTKIPDVGEGTLKSREDPNRRASEDIQHLQPATDFYKNIALQCTSSHIGFDLFFLNSQYVDMASISPISKFTGGCIEYFPNFQAESNPVEVDRFRKTLDRYLTREMAFQAILRIRCTRGLSFQVFHGSGFVRSVDLLNLPISNADMSFGVQVAIDEDIDDSHVHFQAILFYTNSKGQKRSRVENLCLNVSSELTDVLYNANQQAVIAFVAKMAADMALGSSVKDSRECLITAALDLLEAFGKTLNGSSSRQLPCPYLLRAVPLFVFALMKSTAFRLGISTKLDDRVYAIEQLKTLPWPELLQLIYPHFYALHRVDEKNAIEIEDKIVCQPSMLPLSAGALERQGVHLLDTGVYMFLWVSSSVDRRLLRDLLGVAQFGSLEEGQIELPVLDNRISENTRNFIEYLNSIRQVAAPLILLRDDSRDKSLFYMRLIEDRSLDSMNMSYVEFLRSLYDKLP